MPRSSRLMQRYTPSVTDKAELYQILEEHTAEKEKIKLDETAYYNKDKDQQAVQQYYSDIDFTHLNEETLMVALHQLLKETHNHPNSYNPSKYLYPRVDLRPDGTLISVYSGKIRPPEEVIKEDYQTSLSRKSAIEKAGDFSTESDTQLMKIMDKLKYNCEHSVPQSWFNEDEPMRGDLHHLFTCEPVCNSMRSNYPYHDFTGYQPENANIEQIREACGKAEDHLFEPEHGKGTVARGVLYFLIRYPDQLVDNHKEDIDTQLLLKWHEQFPPDLYEKHRNQVIHEMQGNRNPFIDFPEKLKNIQF